MKREIKTHHYSDGIKALNDLKNELDSIYDEDITLKLEYFHETENKALIFDIIAYKGDWEYAKVGILEIL